MRQDAGVDGDATTRGRLCEQSRDDDPVAEQIREFRSNNSKPGLPLPDEAPFRIPANWAWVTLGDLVEGSEAGWSPKTLEHPRVDSEWGVLEVGAVSWGDFRESENKHLLPGLEPRPVASVKRGDSLISRANTVELVARAVIVRNDPVHLMISDKIVRLHVGDSVAHRVVLMVNKHGEHARQHYATLASGVSPSMKNVSRGVILGLPIALPPLAEQRHIVAKVEELMALCDQLEASLAKGDEARRRLLEALLHEALEAERGEAA